MVRSFFWAIIVYSFLFNQAFACACGCGIFEVGTGSMIPTSEGGMAWLEYDFMNQHTNWHGANQSASVNNSDKKIKTDYVTLGSNYMFNRDFGLDLEVPYWMRELTTANDSGAVDRYHHNAFGDLRIKGMWTGLSDDLSTGFLYGLKLPTGDYRYRQFDRDTEIGTGSTDVILGAYHMGTVPFSHSFDWFIEGQWEQTMLIVDHYRPGDEADLAVGSYYTHGKIDDMGEISPLLQFLASFRERDHGTSSDPQNSGYTRLLIAPGIEYNFDTIKVYADIEVPLYQFSNGNQLTAPWLSKVSIATHY